MSLISITFKTDNLLAASCLCLCLSGCNVSAPESRMNDVKHLAAESWYSGDFSEASLDHDWVNSFGDKELSRLVDVALNSAPEIVIAQERVNQARGEISIAGTSFKPTLDAQIDLGESQIRTPFVSRNGLYGIGLSTSWEPDIWGVARMGQSIVMAEYQASGAQLKGAKALLAAQVCKAWFSLCEANKQLALAEESLSLRKEMVDSIQLRFEQSLAVEGGTTSQLRIAQTEVATSKAILAQRRGEKETASRQIEVLLGHYPASKIAGTTRLPQLKKRPPIGLPSDLLLRRPDIFVAERTYANSSLRIKQAKYAVYPSFPLTASFGTSSAELKNILSSDFSVWSIGANVLQPILAGGKTKAEKSKRESLEREALANLQRTVIDAFSEVESALSSEKWMVQRINEFNDALRIAESATESAKDDFKAGNGDLLAWLNAQNTTIEIASQLATLRNLRCQIRTDLHLALGGDFKNSIVK